MKRAFTLIELLVVIAIISILAAILFPVFAKARDKARQSVCLSNEKQIGLAITQYIQDYDEVMPYASITTATPSVTWQDMLVPYIKVKGVYQCPSNQFNTKTFGNNTFVSYAANSCYGYTYGAASSQQDGALGRIDTWGTMPTATMSKILIPASLIVISECNWQYTTIQPSNSFYSSANGYSGTTKSVSLFADHAGMTNYIFADGHSKALLPYQTLTIGEGGSQTVNFWRRDGTPYASSALTSAQAMMNAATALYQQ